MRLSDHNATWMLISPDMGQFEKGGAGDHTHLRLLYKCTFIGLILNYNVGSYCVHEGYKLGSHAAAWIFIEM